MIVIPLFRLCWRTASASWTESPDIECSCAATPKSQVEYSENPSSIVGWAASGEIPPQGGERFCHAVQIGGYPVAEFLKLQKHVGPWAELESGWILSEASVTRQRPVTRRPKLALRLHWSYKDPGRLFGLHGQATTGNPSDNRGSFSALVRGPSYASTYRSRWRLEHVSVCVGIPEDKEDSLNACNSSSKLVDFPVPRYVKAKHPMRLRRTSLTVHTHKHMIRQVRQVSTAIHAASHCTHRCG